MGTWTLREQTEKEETYVSITDECYDQLRKGYAAIQLRVTTTKPIILGDETVARRYMLQLGYRSTGPTADDPNKHMYGNGSVRSIFARSQDPVLLSLAELYPRDGVIGTQFPWCYDKWEQNEVGLLSPGTREYTSPVVRDAWYTGKDGRPLPRGGALPDRARTIIADLGRQLPDLERSLTATVEAMYFQGVFFAGTNPNLSPSQTQSNLLARVRAYLL
jgi:hypothetical protein